MCLMCYCVFGLLIVSWYMVVSVSRFGLCL